MLQLHYLQSVIAAEAQHGRLFTKFVCDGDFRKNLLLFHGENIFFFVWIGNG